MVRTFVLPLLILVAQSGCGRQPLPSNASPVRDFAEAEARYSRLSTGIGEAEITAFMGKGGFAIAGYSSPSVKRTPEGGEGMVAANESSKYWASVDGTSAVHVIFGADGRSRLIELVRLMPMGPPPKIGDE